MKSAKLNDGGPAFPMVLNVELNPDSNRTLGSIESTEGMSLRDWFAGMALNGLLSGEHFSLKNEVIVKMSYELADATIAQREKST